MNDDLRRRRWEIDIDAAVKEWTRLWRYMEVPILWIVVIVFLFYLSGCEFLRTMGGIAGG